LEAEFENDLRNAARECIAQYRYRPTAGFTKLVADYRRPDLTVEHFVATPKYASLFERDEIAKAERWLQS
jgi:hypothetical protein